MSIAKLRNHRAHSRQLAVGSNNTFAEGPADSSVRSQGARPSKPVSLQRARDLKLARRVQSAEPDAFDDLHRLYRQRVYRFALKRLNDAAEAEDVCQDTFLQIYRCIGSYAGRSSLATWIFGVAYHQICRRFRRRSLADVSLDSPQAIETPSGDVGAERQLDAMRALRTCDRVLAECITPAQREVFRLRYQRNYSTRDIATKLGKSTQAVKISLFRTCRTLEKNTHNLAQVLSV